MLGPRSVLNIDFVILSLFFLHVCISFTLNFGRQKRYTKEDICLESIPTVKQVKNCPTDIGTFKERSSKKNCESHLPCGGEPLVYHCVPFDGMLVEVCAPRSLITGRCCTFYDQGLGRVIEDFNRLCSYCPFQYNSDECTKNRECSESIGTIEDPSEQTSSPDNTNPIKTTTKPHKTTNNIIVGDYEGRYEQHFAIVDAMTTVTSVNETERPIQEDHGGLIYVFITVPALMALCFFLVIIYCFRNRLTLTWCTCEDGQKKMNIKLKETKLTAHYDGLMFQESKEVTKDELKLLRRQEEF